MQFEANIDVVTLQGNDEAITIEFQEEAVDVEVSYGPLGTHPVVDFKNGITMEFIDGDWVMFRDGHQYTIGEEVYDENGDPVADAGEAPYDLQRQTGGSQGIIVEAAAQAASLATVWAGAAAGAMGAAAKIFEPPPLKSGR